LASALTSVFCVQSKTAVKVAGYGLMALFASCGVGAQEFTASPEEARGIAKEAYLYGFPVVEMYKTLYTQAIDTKSPNYKAPLNQIGNTAKAFTAKDTAFVTPNADTPYSFIWMDLRTEPLVLTLPPIEEHRYYSVQLIDAYTQNFAYLGTRSTGNNGGHFMIAGPDWQGQQPLNIDRLLRSESNITYALYRTQLFDAKDLAKVKQIQKGYKVEPLSHYVKQKAPAPAPKITWPKPTPTMSETPDLFRYLNFMLAFTPPQDVEKDLLARFAKIGIGAGQPFDLKTLTADQRKALEDASPTPRPSSPNSRKTRSTPTRSAAVISSAPVTTSKATICIAMSAPIWESSATPPKRPTTSATSSTRTDNRPMPQNTTTPCISTRVPCPPPMRSGR